MILKINTIDYTTQISVNGFRYEENITSKVDILNMRYIKTASKTYVPAVGDEVELYDEGVQVFGGEIIQVSCSVVADLPAYDIQVKDWVHTLDRRLVADSYQAQDLAQTVKDILASYAPDISEGTIDTTGIVIEDIVFNYARPSDAIRTIAEYAGFDWWITPAKELYFMARGANGAPFDVTTTNVKDLTLMKNDKQLKNVIYVMGGDYVGASITDTLSKGDGTRVRFPIPYVYDSAPVVKVNAVTQTVGVEGLHTTGYDCYWNRNEKIISFATAPADPYEIEITGDPLLPLLVKMTAPDLTKGVYEFKIVDRSIKTKDAVRRRARAELDAYASTIAEAQFTTDTAGLRAGQRITVTNDVLGVTAEKYVIQQIIATRHHTGTLKYTVRLANTKAFEIIEFMRMLLEMGDKTVGGLGDSTALLDTIMTLSEQVIANEVYSFNRDRHTVAEQVTLGEDIKMRTNYVNTWVWGLYEPTSIDDIKRTPLWSKGAVWA
ncbi:MAG: hypothetical protein KAT71_08260 [Gammaproteobacteria bacterium]|nr:hypothetical protein [Gammaproteobacteria bacterium]